MYLLYRVIHNRSLRTTVSDSPDQQSLRQHLLEGETPIFLSPAFHQNFFRLLKVKGCFVSILTLPQIDLKLGGKLQKHGSSNKTEIDQGVHHYQQEPPTILIKLARLYAKTCCQRENMRYLSTCLRVSESSSVPCQLEKYLWFEGLHSARNWSDFPRNALPKSYPN